MDASTNSSQFRSSSIDLDGRRHIAGGMPSHIEGADDNNYSYWYQRANKHYGNNYHWDSERWEQEYKFCANAYNTYGRHDGWMSCLWDMYQQQLTREENQHEKSIARAKLDSELGPREFTLTYSDAWYEDDEAAQHAMKVAIDKLTRYYKDEITEFHAIGEFTKAGRCHIHGWYHLTGGRKITDKNFKRAWSHWNPKKKLGKGFEGGHHATITRVSDFAGYAEKHLEEAWMKVDITNASTTDRTASPNGSLLQEASYSDETQSQADQDSE